MMGKHSPRCTQCGRALKSKNDHDICPYCRGFRLPLERDDEWSPEELAGFRKRLDEQRAALNQITGNQQTFACNCMYGSQDPRCCIAKARRAELEEAHRLGREGLPLPSLDEPIKAFGWFRITPESMKLLEQERDKLSRLVGEEKQRG